jgi:hypothetical protein
MSSGKLFLAIVFVWGAICNLRNPNRAREGIHGA